MTQAGDETLWTDEALFDRPEWARIRRLARSAIEAVRLEIETAK
jgi:hypothetical protein